MRLDPSDQVRSANESRKSPTTSRSLALKSLSAKSRPWLSWFHIEGALQAQFWSFRQLSTPAIGAQTRPSRIRDITCPAGAQDRNLMEQKLCAAPTLGWGESIPFWRCHECQKMIALRQNCYQIFEQFAWPSKFQLQDWLSWRLSSRWKSEGFPQDLEVAQTFSKLLYYWTLGSVILAFLEPYQVNFQHFIMTWSRQLNTQFHGLDLVS